MHQTIRTGFVIVFICIAFALVACEHEDPPVTTTTTTATIDSNTFTTVQFSGEDGLLITADMYGGSDASTPLILLFHQNGSSRGEYRQIAPVLVEMGFACLAVDTRSGGTDKWNGVENETTAGADDPLSGQYLNVYPDLVASLSYASGNFSSTIITWGSSFSSSLIFKLAGEHDTEVSAFLSFSPGEYIKEDRTAVSQWAADIDHIPCFVACGAEEAETAEPIFESISSQNKTFYHSLTGKHGTSILMDNESNWIPVKQFLEDLVP